MSHEGRPQGAPLPIANRSRLKDRSPEGLYSAVLSEWGLNQVVSRVLAQMDAIALGPAGGRDVGSGGRAAVKRPNRHNLLKRVNKGSLKGACGGRRRCQHMTARTRDVRALYERLREIGQKNLRGATRADRWSNVRTVTVFGVGTRDLLEERLRGSKGFATHERSYERCTRVIRAFTRDRAKKFCAAGQA